jgi:hypothetical protein
MLLAEGQGFAALAVFGIVLALFWMLMRLLGVATYRKKSKMNRDDR